MADRRLIAAAMAVLVGVVVVVAVLIAYRDYTDRYVVKADDSVAIAQIVRATLSAASELKVSTLSGTVQSTASDTRGLGMFTSERVMKAPFAVDYFVDVADLDDGDMAWNPATRTLMVNAPGIRVGAVNIDEAHTYLDRTTGVFVTRGAMAALQRQASGRAERVAAIAARRPDHLAQARENARGAIARLFAGPLAAAGLEAKIVVRFGDEPSRDGARWDTSRSLQEILGNR